ncbi:alanine racemase [Sphingomonas sp. ASY06-1R]|uniref:alanine racemase n=1 Tax=Sphingomonas sp. ASY06-1R TaxID=3445771 RepID=UPI003FA207BD
MTADLPLRLILDGAALVANWRWLAARSGAAACGAAIKANGYGLGARAVAARLAGAGCRDFFVATWSEAAALGPLPEGAALSVLHGVRAEDMAAACDSPARPVLNSVEQVRRWREAGGGACDVMVDTGMNRLGLSVDEALSDVLAGLPIETLMSHLACAEEGDHPLNARQLAAFRPLRERVPARRYSLANSAGVLLGEDYAFDLTRPGLALYGGQPGPDAAAIRPVAAIAAQILQVRTVAAGESVGYGACWRTLTEARVAVLNLGYADGYRRALAAGSWAEAGGVRCPLIGRVSMDLIAIDVTAATAGEGDWVTIPLDLPALAARSGQSQYEILTGLQDRFERHWR